MELPDEDEKIYLVCMPFVCTYVNEETKNFLHERMKEAAQWMDEDPNRSLGWRVVEFTSYLGARIITQLSMINGITKINPEIEKNRKAMNGWQDGVDPWDADPDK